MRRVFGGVIVASVWLAGCENSCQNLCEQMAAFADECGAPVGAGELETCIDDFSDASGEQLDACADFGSPDVVRRQWTCDDLTLYNTRQ
jgi:hypothetical protein